MQPDWTPKRKPGKKRSAARPWPDQRLYRRPDGKGGWHPVIYCSVLDPAGTGKTRRLSTDCQDPLAASKRADEFERTAADPTYRASKETTLAEAINDLQIGLKWEGRAEGTIETIVNRLGHFVHEWGADFPIGHITGAKMTEYINSRMKDPGRNGTLSRTTCGVEVMAMKRLLKRAAFLEKFHRPIDSVIMSGMIGKASRDVERWATMEQSWEIIRALPRRASAQLAWICATGCRAEEVRRVRRADFIKIERVGIIPIDGTKTRHCREVAREIPVSDLTRPFLDYAMANAEPGDRPFTVLQGSLRHMIQDVCLKELGIGWEVEEDDGTMRLEHFSPNDFRRGFCHWHMDAGYSEETCALLLRHKDTTMVRKVYGQHDRRGKKIGEKMRVEMIQKQVAASGLPAHAVAAISAILREISPVSNLSALGGPYRPGEGPGMAKTTGNASLAEEHVA